MSFVAKEYGKKVAELLSFPNFQEDDRWYCWHDDLSSFSIIKDPKTFVGCLTYVLREGLFYDKLVTTSSAADFLDSYIPALIKEGRLHTFSELTTAFTNVDPDSGIFNLAMRDSRQFVGIFQYGSMCQDFIKLPEDEIKAFAPVVESLIQLWLLEDPTRIHFFTHYDVVDPVLDFCRKHHSDDCTFRKILTEE